MICQHCRREVPEGEPSYRASDGDTNWSHRWRGYVGYLCTDCKDEWARIQFRLNWSIPRDCENCGRPVYHDNRRRIPKRVVCSHQCRSAIYNHFSRPRAKPRPCEICGEEFQPKRFDARHCSSACRQKAYRESLIRHRRRSTEDGACTRLGEGVKASVRAREEEILSACRRVFPRPPARPHCELGHYR